MRHTESGAELAAKDTCYGRVGRLDLTKEVGINSVVRNRITRTVRVWTVRLRFPTSSQPSSCLLFVAALPFWGAGAGLSDEESVKSSSSSVSR
jgi:hypothetical protein